MICVQECDSLGAGLPKNYKEVQQLETTKVVDGTMILK
jgi:hypothetical protein